METGIILRTKEKKNGKKINYLNLKSLSIYTITGVGRLPKKFKSAFSPNKYASGCGVSNLSPPIMKCVPK